MIRMVLRQLLLMAIGLTATISALAQGMNAPRIPPKYKGDTTAVEIAQLPKYCYWQYVDGAYWGDPTYSIQGCGPYVNHYCQALVAMMRAQQFSRPLSERLEIVRMAIDSFEYTLGFNLPETCPHRGDFLASLARAKAYQRFLKSLSR